MYNIRDLAKLTAVLYMGYSQNSKYVKKSKQKYFENIANNV